ncbi:MAG: Rossmann-like and DUF2520 domain-containing protein [Betaproteobacteria bacterium]
MSDSHISRRLGFVGAGRVGKGLSLALARAGYTVSGVSSRSGPLSAHDVAGRSDIVFVTVPDDRIAAVTEKISWRKGQAAVHCSGAAELSVLDAAARQGAATGGFHPLQMFADPEVAASGLGRCAIAVEAQDWLESDLNAMVRRLGATLLRIPPGGRAAYHAAAHYAAAFLCASINEGVEVWKRIGIPPEDALPALLSLARGAMDAVERSGPARAMAGSIARGDLATVRRHVEALEKIDPKLCQHYCRMALKTVPMSLEAGGMDGARAAQIRALLEKRSN